MKAYIFLVAAIVVLMSCNNNKVFVPANDPGIVYIGRADFTNPHKPAFMMSGFTIRTCFKGTSAEVFLKDTTSNNYYDVMIDSSLQVLHTNPNDTVYLLADSLKNTWHTLEIIRRTEWHGGNSVFMGLRLDPHQRIKSPEVKTRKIEFIGNSYVCGYGDEGKSREDHFSYPTENFTKSFAQVTAKNLNAECVAVCRSGIRAYSGNGGNSFNMLSLYEEIVSHSKANWDYSKWQPNVVVIELGSNDFDDIDSTQFSHAYLKFLKKIRRHYANATIVCAAGPCGMEDKDGYCRKFQNFIKGIVNEANKTEPKINYFYLGNVEFRGSDWHPSATEHIYIAGLLTQYLKTLMNW